MQTVKVEITAKRHLNNYFIDEQDLKSIAKELRPNLIVTQESIFSFYDIFISNSNSNSTNTNRNNLLDGGVANWRSCQF